MPRLVPPDVPIGIHGELIAAHFRGLGGEALVVDPDLRVLLMCFVNRSGSFHLAELLASTGRLPLAEESLNAEVVVAAARRHGLGSFPAYLGHLARAAHLADSGSAGGWLALKVGVHQLRLLCEAGFLDAVAPRLRFLLVDRRDRVAQAVSRAIAEQTGSWAAFMPARPGAAPVYDRRRIEAAVGEIADFMRGFEAFFAANAIAPVRVVYEELVARPQAEVDRVLAELGMPPAPIDMSRPRWRSQHGALNVAWRQQYLSGG
jgi:LPS sulfotransferase NodH